MRHHTASLCVLALATTALFSAVAQAEDISREFEVVDGGRVEIDLESGGIKVQVGESNMVRVTVQVRGANADQFELDFDQRGEEIRVRGRTPGKHKRYNNRDLAVEVRAEVPKRFDLKLDTSGGSIEVGDVDGEVDADTAGGSIVIGRVTGPVRADTAGGSIEVLASVKDVDADTAGGSIDLGEIQGSIKADTAGGSIRVERALGRSRLSTAGGSITVKDARAGVDADTVGGGIKVDYTAQPADHSSLSTTGGSITVGLAEGIGFDLDARSDSRIRSAFAVDDDEDDPKRLHGRLNGGGPELEIDSSGRVRIEKR